MLKIIRLVIISISCPILLMSCETFDAIGDVITTFLNDIEITIENQAVSSGPLIKRLEHEGWPVHELDTARTVEYLTENEKDVILATNAVRTNPSMFAELYVKEALSYYHGNYVKHPGDPTRYITHEGASAVQELYDELVKTKPIGVLHPSRGMSLGASDHSQDQSVTGATGHTGSDGSSPWNRIDRYGKSTYSGENISYAYFEGLRIILALLIDDNVPSRGHRKNILNAKFATSGISINTHPVYGHMCVIVYAGNYTEQ